MALKIPSKATPGVTPTFFESPLAFRHWLADNAATATELRVGFHKVATGQPCMTWSESVDEALCFGWIDGVRKRIDDKAYSIRFTPRKSTSIWSAINIAKVAQLRAQGRMTSAGEQAFAQRTDARSLVYSHERTEAAALTPEEEHTFKSNPAAWAYWESCPPGYRRQMLHVVVSAKRAETRASRLAKLMATSAKKERWGEPTPGKTMKSMDNDTSTSEEPSASERISQRIATLADWRGETLATMRKLIQQADPDVVEEWKWRGTPVWSHNGIVCTGETYKDKVKLTFAKGASLNDPAQLFNASMDGNARRAIDIHEGDAVDASAFQALFLQAMALNSAKKSKSASSAKPAKKAKP
jgi:hypothetical protein